MPIARRMATTLAALARLRRNHRWSADGCRLLAYRSGDRTPTPFMMIVGTPSVIITVVLAILWSQKEQIRNTPGAFGKMLPYFYVLFCQVAMTMIYPLYNHIFMGLSSMEQTAFVLLLPIIKIACNLWINHSLRNAEDFKPESIIVNVEVFHALFVSYCMQSSTSLRTILVMVLLDLALILISTQGVWSTMNSLQHMIDALGPQGTDIGCVHNLMDVTLSLVRGDPQRYASIKPTQHQLFNKRVGPAALQSVTLGSATCLSQVVPTAFTDPSNALTTDRVTSRSFIAVMALQLMYLTEFIVLVEYTEFIMPLICSVYVSALSHSSNHEFYQFLEGITAANLTTRLANTSLYMLAELLTLLLISILIWWKLGYSLLHQLAFVLEARQVRVQTKLVL